MIKDMHWKFYLNGPEIMHREEGGGQNTSKHVGLIRSQRRKYICFSPRLISHVKARLSIDNIMPFILSFIFFIAAIILRNS